MCLTSARPTSDRKDAVPPRTDGAQVPQTVSGERLRRAARSAHPRTSGDGDRGRPGCPGAVARHRRGAGRDVDDASSAPLVSDHARGADQHGTPRCALAPRLPTLELHQTHGAPHAQRSRSPGGCTCPPGVFDFLKEQALAQAIDLYFLDECGFTPTLPTTYTWARIGTRVTVPYVAPQADASTSLARWDPMARSRVWPTTAAAARSIAPPSSRSSGAT